MEIPPELVAAKNLAEPALLALPGVVGIGIGMREENGEVFDELAVRVLVDDLSQIPPDIPSEIGGVAVSIIEAQVEPCVSPDTSRYAELAGGIQVTCPAKGFGTMGAVVQSSTGELLGLSCYHVVGDTNNSFPHTIWQPTNPPLIHGSSPPADDNVGHVIGVDFPRTQPLPFSPVVVGLVDAAVFTLDEALTHGRSTSPKIVGQDAPAIMIDRVTATAWPEPGHEVRKRGGNHAGNQRRDHRRLCDGSVDGRATECIHHGTG